VKHGVIEPVPPLEGGWPAENGSPRPNGAEFIPRMKAPLIGLNPSWLGRFLVGRAVEFPSRVLTLSSRSSAFRFLSAMRRLSASRFLRLSIVLLSTWMRSGLGWELRTIEGVDAEAVWGGGAPANRTKMSDGVNMINPLGPVG